MIAPPLRPQPSSAGIDRPIFAGCFEPMYKQMREHEATVKRLRRDLEPVMAEQANLAASLSQFRPEIRAKKTAAMYAAQSGTLNASQYAAAQSEHAALKAVHAMRPRDIVAAAKFDNAGRFNDLHRMLRTDLRRLDVAISHAIATNDRTELAAALSLLSEAPEDVRGRAGTIVAELFEPVHTLLSKYATWAVEMANVPRIIVRHLEPGAPDIDATALLNAANAAHAAGAAVLREDYVPPVVAERAPDSSVADLAISDPRALLDRANTPPEAKGDDMDDAA